MPKTRRSRLYSVITAYGDIDDTVGTNETVVAEHFPNSRDRRAALEERVLHLLDAPTHHLSDEELRLIIERSVTIGYGRVLLTEATRRANGAFISEFPAAAVHPKP